VLLWLGSYIPSYCAVVAGVDIYTIILCCCGIIYHHTVLLWLGLIYIPSYCAVVAGVDIYTIILCCCGWGHIYHHTVLLWLGLSVRRGLCVCVLLHFVGAGLVYGMSPLTLRWPARPSLTHGRAQRCHRHGRREARLAERAGGSRRARGGPRDVAAQDRVRRGPVACQDPRPPDA
jgi:hypothetical protein